MYKTLLFAFSKNIESFLSYFFGLVISITKINNQIDFDKTSVAKFFKLVSTINKSQNKWELGTLYNFIQSKVPTINQIFY